MSPIFNPQAKNQAKPGGLSDFESLLKQAAAAYRLRSSLFVPLVTMSFLFLILFNLVHYFAAGLEPAWSARFIIGATVWAAAFLAMAGSYLFYQIAARLVLAAGGPARLKELWRSARPFFLPITGLMALILAILGVWSWLAVLASQAGAWSSIFLLAVAALALPVVLAIAHLFFASFIIIDKKAGLAAALRQSRPLLAGHVWALAGKFGLLALLNLAVLSLMSYVSSLLAANPTIGGLASLVFGWVNSLIGPVYILFGHQLYGELKSLKH